MFNSPINEVSLMLKLMKKLNEISKLLNEDGKTIVNINLTENDKKLNLDLKKPKEFGPKIT